MFDIDEVVVNIEVQEALKQIKDKDSLMNKTI